MVTIIASLGCNVAVLGAVRGFYVAWRCFINSASSRPVCSAPQSPAYHTAHLGKYSESKLCYFMRLY